MQYEEKYWGRRMSPERQVKIEKNRNRIEKFLKKIPLDYVNGDRCVPPNINLADLNDPLALEVSWRPLSDSASNFKTHKLQKQGNEIMVFRSSKRFVLISLMVIAMGISLPFLAFVEDANDIWHAAGKFAACLVGGIAFTWVGFNMYRTASQGYVFDKGQGLFFPGGKKASKEVSLFLNNNAQPIKKIYAIQLIQEIQYNHDDRPYRCYEINLVMQDGSRIQAVEHGDLQQAKRDAQRLGQFLEKPVWDVV